MNNLEVQAKIDEAYHKALDAIGCLMDIPEELLPLGSSACELLSWLAEAIRIYEGRVYQVGGNE